MVHLTQGICIRMILYHLWFCLYNYSGIESFMGVQGAIILDKLTVTATILAICKFEVQTSLYQHFLKRLNCCVHSHTPVHNKSLNSVQSIFVPFSFKSVEVMPVPNFYMRGLWLHHFPEHVKELGSMLASAKRATILLVWATKEPSKATISQPFFLCLLLKCSHRTQPTMKSL